MDTMRVRAGRIRRPVLAIALGVAATALGACGPGGSGALSPGGLPAISVASGAVTDTQSQEAGQVSAPVSTPESRTFEAAQEQGASGILAKNSSKFAGEIMVPPGILAKNSSKYRVAGFAQVPFGQGLVELLTPDGFYFLDAAGQPITAMTDDLGRYDFGAFTIPVGKDVLVAARFPGNRLLFQYAHSAVGTNRVDVDAAGTYVSAYLVALGQRLERSPSSFDLAGLPKLRGLTHAMLEDGSLALDPELLALGRSGDLVASYQAAFRAGSPGLAQAWDALLGQ